MYSTIAVAFTQFGEAPGDFDGFCRHTERFVQLHTFPAEVKILLDTYDYVNLFRGFGRTWITFDNDGDGNYWRQETGDVCQWNLRACTGNTTQDNWLFSQLIRYLDANEVLFNVSYTFEECVPPCTRDYVTLYGFQSNHATFAAPRIDISNYQSLFGDEEASRLQQSGATGQQMNTLRLIPPANSSGFHLGVRDEGTCGQVDRIIIHYLVCPFRVDGLVIYPETALPPLNSPDIIVDAKCAANSHNTTTLQVRASSGHPRGCTPLATGKPECVCNAGHVLSEDATSCQGSV